MSIIQYSIELFFFILFSAETDYFVYNRAIASFVKKAPAAKMFIVPDSYHEVLQEKELTRDACRKVINDFFNQKSDNVTLVQPCYPLVSYDPTTPLYSLSEIILRGTGVLIATVGIITGVAMILGDRK